MDTDTRAQTMFEALNQWVHRLHDIGDLPNARSAAESLRREARTSDDVNHADRLIAELCEKAGDFERAKGPRTRLVEAARARLAEDPSTARRLELLSALDHLADAADGADDHWTVLECHGHRGRLAELHALIAQHGRQRVLLTEVCYSLRRAGAAARAMGSVDEAQSLLEERLTTARLIAALNPADPRAVQMVVAGLADLGALYLALGLTKASGLAAEEQTLRTWLAGAVQDRQISMGDGVDTGEHQINTSTQSAPNGDHSGGVLSQDRAAAAQGWFGVGVSTVS